MYILLFCVSLTIYAYSPWQGNFRPALQQPFPHPLRKRLPEAVQNYINKLKKNGIALKEEVGSAALFVVSLLFSFFLSFYFFSVVKILWLKVASHVTSL